MRIFHLMAYVIVATFVTCASAAAIGVGAYLDDPQLIFGSVPIGAMLGLAALSMWQDIGRALGHVRNGQPASFDW